MSATEAIDVASVERSTGSTMSGCHGTALYHHAVRKGERRGEMSHGFDPERMLGRHLGAGTIVEVTVRVITEHPMPAADECLNPWSGHAGRKTLRSDGTPSYVGTHCVGHPEHEAAS